MRRLIVAVLALALGAVAPATAHAADSAFDTNTRVGSWDAAAAQLGTAGSLWEPQWRADLQRSRRIQVIADNLSFANAAVTAGDTYAGTRYGVGGRSFWIDEKWANTGWSAEPVTSTSMAKVEDVRLRLGMPGMRTTVVARVYADCFPQPANADPKEIPRGFRCTRADVLRHGGTLMMTARPASTMTAPGDTSVVIRTTGITYRELLRIAASMQQVAGTPSVAGSAQMVAMCRQMVTGAMSFEQASAFAESNGYSARIGSIDGKPLPVTADYRPDRFTVDVTAGVVASCMYG